MKRPRRELWNVAVTGIAIEFDFYQNIHTFDHHNLNSYPMEPKDKVLKTIKDAGKPMKAGEIADASGIDKKDVEKHIKKLVAEGTLHSPIRCFYDVKK